MKKIVFYFLSLFFMFSVFTQEICEDGVCDIPLFDENGKNVYAVVSPVGYHKIDMIEQAPRLDTLENKTIALIGGSFMAHITHNQLKECIEKEFPNNKVFMFDEVGNAGPFNVFDKSTKVKTFQDKLKELNVDAVIVGNCGCGLCTTKETGSSIASEYIGIPSVTIGSSTFVSQIHSTGVNRGVSVLRAVEYPGSFSAHSVEELKRNTIEVLWPQIKKALTTQITQEEINSYSLNSKGPYDEIIYTGTFDEVQEYFSINNWTDGLPIIPPTLEKIEEYSVFTSYPKDKVIGIFPIAYRECNVFTIIANAIMAGVPKEYLPMCIAFVECMDNGKWRRPLSSTHGWTPYAWFNGPLARQLKIDNQQGMISESINKVLGRFIDLCMLNIGGYYVKENRMGTFGYLTPWTFSENEQACLNVGWEPYHVSKGYDLNSNTITASSALLWGNNLTPATDDAQIIKDIIAFDITEKQQNALGNTNPQVCRTIFITEDIAKKLSTEFTTKEKLEDSLIKTARRPLALRAYAHYWANTGSQQYKKHNFKEHYKNLLNDKKEKAQLTETPAWYKSVIKEDKIMTIATMKKNQTAILITGDPSRNKVQIIPGGDNVTVEIKLPSNWNELVIPLGYRPIEDYYLTNEKN